MSGIEAGSAAGEKSQEERLVLPADATREERRRLISDHLQAHPEIIRRLADDAIAAQAREAAELDSTATTYERGYWDQPGMEGA